MSTDYDTDFYLWTQQQKALLAEHRFAELDLENLIEEVDSMGRRERHALLSQLTRLLEHLLKWRYSTPGPLRERDLAGWATTIGQARTDIEFLIEASPSLRPYPGQVLDKTYRVARRQELMHPAIDPRVFPQDCPWTIEQVLTRGFFPEPLP